MARPIIRLYDQRTTPQGPSLPVERAPDAQTNIGASLARFGDAIGGVAEAGIANQRADLQVEQIRQQRDEEDGRAYAAQASAQFRAQASAIQRQVFQDAPDGWRGATQTASQQIGALRTSLVNDAPTDAAKHFVNQVIDADQPMILEGVAGQEQQQRQRWRLDTVRSAIDTDSSTLAANPGGYAAMDAQHRTLITGMTDLSADQRRDLQNYADGTLARSAVVSMIDRDPAATLRHLRDPNAEGPYAKLDGAQRNQAINMAESELRSRAAEFRSNIREARSNAEDAWRLGVTPTSFPSVENVRAAEGDIAAASYHANMLAYSRQSELQHMPSQQLALMASRPLDQHAGEAAQLDQRAQSIAAANVLQQRQDPVAYVQSQGRIVSSEALVGALQSNDTRLLTRVMQGRQAVMTGEAGRLGMPLQLVTAAEAQQMRAHLDALPMQGRAAFFSTLQNTLGSRALSSLAGQIYADAPGAQLAMQVQGRGQVFGARSGVNGDVAARWLTDGAAALGSVQQQNSPNEQGANRPRRAFAMPSDGDLRQAWTQAIGNAYQGMPQTEQAAYEAFREAYAGASITAGDSTGQLDPHRASDAVAIATGGIMRTGGGMFGGASHATILPWGMSATDFRNSIAAGWQRLQQAGSGGDRQSDIAGQDWRNFDFTPNGPGTYAVGRTVGDQFLQARDSHGVPITVQFGSH